MLELLLIFAVPLGLFLIVLLILADKGIGPLK